VTFRCGWCVWQHRGGVAVFAKEVAAGTPGITLLLRGVKLVHRSFLRGDLVLLLLLLLLHVLRLLLRCIRRVGGVIVPAVVIGVPQALPRCQGLHFLLHFALVVVIGCHSLEKREFRERERVIGSTRESERCFDAIYSRRRWHIGRDTLIMGRGASNSQ
jgi:hypothetical protein